MFYLAGFCPDGPECKAAHPKWSKDLDKPTVKVDKKEEDDGHGEGGMRDDDGERMRDGMGRGDRDRDDGRHGRGHHRGGGGKWRGRGGRFRGRGH